MILASFASGFASTTESTGLYMNRSGSRDELVVAKWDIPVKKLFPFVGLAK